jgi:hypothetical protein
VRKLYSLFAIAAMTILFGVLSTGTAAAFGSEQLGCRVIPSSIYQPIDSPSCAYTYAPNPNYNISYVVQNGSGTYSYAWSVPSPYSGQILNGCGSADNWCQIYASNNDAEITVSVTITQGSNQRTISATAEVAQWCGNYLC